MHKKATIVAYAVLRVKKLAIVMFYISGISACFLSRQLGFSNKKWLEERSRKIKVLANKD